MLQIAGRALAPRLIVFDKDGTLIAYDPVWHAWWAHWRAHLQAALDDLAVDDTVFWQELQAVLGYGPDPDEWDPLGPLTLASTDELALLIAGALYVHAGRTWSQAQAMARAAENAARAAIAEQDLLQPIGDVAGTLRRLHEAGVLLAVATTDNRGPRRGGPGAPGRTRSTVHHGVRRRRRGAQAGAGHGVGDRPAAGCGPPPRRPWWAIPLPI